MSQETNEPNQQENVIADYADELQQLEMQGYERAVRKARNALFWAGGLYFFWETIGMIRSDTPFNPLWLVIALIESGIFIALAFWTKKKPFTAVLCGLIYFIALIILVAVLYAMTEGSLGVAKALFSGVIIKVIIIINLSLPLRDAKALQEAMNREVR
jgi:hypothetical protein